jgi:hypothetical protein
LESGGKINLPFTTPVHISFPLREGDLYETVEPLNYYSPKRQKNYVVPAGFKSNLASVPRLPVVFWLVGRRGDAAAVLHDWLYENGSNPRYGIQIKNKDEADEVYL